MKSSFSRKKNLMVFVSVTVLLAVSGCQLTENTLKADRSTGQNIQDYRDMLAPREAPLEHGNNETPELKPYVADTSASLKPMPLVSISINQSIPLRDALFELAKQADFDIQLDPRIRGSIIYTARNKPFDTVISQISELAGLRYKLSDDGIKIELDTPYTKTYKVEYLSMTRESKSAIDTSTKVDAGDQGTNSSGSSFGISSESKTDFWGELDTNIKQILEANSQLNYQITAQDPELAVSTPVQANPPVPPLDENSLSDPGMTEPQAGEEKRSSLESHISAGQQVPQVPNSSAPTASGNVPTGSSVPPTTSPPDDQSAQRVGGTSIAPTPGAGATVAQPQQVQLNVSSLPPVTTADGGTTYTPSYSINKQAGLLSVYATQKAQDEIASYIELVAKRTTSQVLIEAKVLEVELSDEFSYGISWDDLIDGRGISFNAARASLTPTEAATFVLSGKGNDILNLLSAIQRFGTVHALASPRLTVLNNQSAVLNVAENQVYFSLDVTRTEGQDGQPDTIDVDSEIRNVPEGILINVTPSMDLDRNQISLQVRPTISRITGFIPDPVVPLVLAQAGINDPTISSQVPVVSTKEMDTILKMQSGQTMVMGGLLEDRSDSVQRAVPILGEMPLVGAAFRGQEDKISKNEIVVLIKATIINNTSDTVHNTDKELYRVYSQDRRPFKL